MIHRTLVARGLSCRSVKIRVNRPETPVFRHVGVSRKHFTRRHGPTWLSFSEFVLEGYATQCPWSDCKAPSPRCTHRRESVESQGGYRQFSSLQNRFCNFLRFVLLYFIDHSIHIIYNVCTYIYIWLYTYSFHLSLLKDRYLLKALILKIVMCERFISLSRLIILHCMLIVIITPDSKERWLQFRNHWGSFKSL